MKLSKKTIEELIHKTGVAEDEVKNEGEECWITTLSELQEVIQNPTVETLAERDWAMGELQNAIDIIQDNIGTSWWFRDEEIRQMRKQLKALKTDYRTAQKLQIIEE